MKKRIAEFRANLKSLTEQRNDKATEMQALVEAAKTETRAMTAEEIAKFDALEKEIAGIDATIAAEERASKLEIKKEEVKKKDETVADVERRAFETYIKKECGIFVETRAGEQNVTMGNNGAVIPTTIANQIITTVKEMCPILAKCTMYNVKGTLKVPVWGLANTSHDITVAFQSEFTDITADSGKFTSVDLTGYLAGALTLIGESVINSAEVDVVGFVIREMSKKIALFLEGKLLNGQSSYNTGALSTSTNINAGSTTAISMDNLIELQAKVPTAYQNDCAWTMAPATFTSIRKLKDGNGQYLVQPSLIAGVNYTILGKPVYLSDNMPAIGSGNKAVLYGDYSGLSVNMRENISVRILLEKYATQHAIGIVSWFEFDSNVTDNQKLATLTMS